MEVQYRARRSFEKPHVEAPPRLQVIGFNVSPKAEAAALPGPIEGMEIASCARASYNELSPSPLPKPASSPRSALQQLLLHQSPPSTSPSSSNHCLPPLLPPSSSSPSANQTLITAGSPTSHKPASSSPSSNRNLTNGFLQPAAANHKWTNDGLLHPFAANEKWSSAGVSRPQSPPAASAYQSNSSIGHLKSILQSACTSSDIPANQSSRASILSSLVQSQCASSSASGGSQTMISKQMINQQNPKALIKDNYEAFFQIKQTSHAADVKAREIKGRLISTNKVTNESPYAVKSKKSSWIHDEDDQPSAGKYKKSSWKGSNEHPLGNEKSRKSSWSEEKSKKSSLFMFAASSPAPEAHHQHHSGEHNIAFKDMDFLSSCHLCRRFLGQGQDVFMYSGDKAFCSMECRYQQIVIDERKERCPPAIIRSGASPVYQHISVTASSTHHPITINKPHFINTAAAA